MLHEWLWFVHIPFVRQIIIIIIIIIIWELFIAALADVFPLDLSDCKSPQFSGLFSVFWPIFKML